MIMVLQREMKARLMEIWKEELEIIYLGVYVVDEGEYYFKKNLHREWESPVDEYISKKWT